MMVMKFGGTSLGSAARILNVAHLIATEAAKQPVVVASAMSQVTNLLIELCGQVTDPAQADQISDGLDRLRRLHHQTAHELKLEPLAEEELRLLIDALINQLAEILKSIASLGELTPRGQD